MSTGPLRRLVGTAGLLALAPTALMLVMGSITPTDAAIRAVATLAATMLIGRVVTWWLAATASSFERADRPDGPSAEPYERDVPARRDEAAPQREGPKRRRTDHAR